MYLCVFRADLYLHASSDFPIIPHLFSNMPVNVIPERCVLPLIMMYRVIYNRHTDRHLTSIHR